MGEATVGSVTFSVLIGRVSTVDGERILETLLALKEQDVDFTYEVILADRLQDDVSRVIACRFPDVHVISSPSTASLPEMRAKALNRSTGEYIAVTEDHCVPPPSWLRSFRDAFVRNPGVAAVAGCVENGVNERALDQATFLCEYAAFLPPIREGRSTALAGMNIAYDRRILLGVPAGLLTSGFWETTVHPWLEAHGALLIATNDIRTAHCKRFTFGLFVAQRYAYSRYYAGIRFPRKRRATRMAAALATPALPILLSLRLLRAACSTDIGRSTTLRAYPFLLVFYVAWAAGESVGYLLGPGLSLQAIE